MEIKYPVLVVGIPRSGTTWVGRVFSQTDNCVYFQEPDNEKESPIAFTLKRKLHRFPYIKDGNCTTEYYQLWKTVYDGKRLPDRLHNALFKYCIPNSNSYDMEKEIAGKCGLINETRECWFEEESLSDGKNRFKKYCALKKLNFIYRFFSLRLDGYPKKKEQLIVKSVHAVLSLPWICKNFNFQVVLVIRHPLNVLSSYLKLKMPDSMRNILIQENIIDDYFLPYLSVIRSANRNIEKIALQIGLLYKILEMQASIHPEWIIISHEELCKNPTNGFIKLFDKLNLKWSNRVEKFLDSRNKPGDGFEINRIAIKEIDKWRRLLTQEQVNEALKIIRLLDLKFYPEL